MNNRPQTDNGILVLCSLCGRLIPVLDRVAEKGEVIAVYRTPYQNICLVCHVNNTVRILINPINIVKTVDVYFRIIAIKKNISENINHVNAKEKVKENIKVAKAKK
jgi:hypothetical protein